MSEPVRLTTSQTVVSASPILYLWRGNGIVLIGEYSNGRWVLARGWVTVEALEHVRRWTFAAPGPFAGQVRRLVAEACGDHLTARNESTRALAWTSLMGSAH